MERGSGVLCHISSLPSNYGIGTFGKEAYKFIRLLKKNKQKYWQFLPLNPTSFKDSPYQSFSAFALNPYFIDLDKLIDDGLLTKEEVEQYTWGEEESKVDYGRIYENRDKVLFNCYKRGFAKQQARIKRFLDENKYWLDDYATFMTIKKIYNSDSWINWAPDLKNRKLSVINNIKEDHSDIYYYYVYLQYTAYSQYKKLRAYAKVNNILLVGDLPIYVSLDSSDVWANKQFFQLDSSNNPAMVAGVPPDYFSATGQLWGNPLYKYDVMKKDHYDWWTKRFKYSIKLYDFIRVDHFRGFEAYYAIPATEKTAINGKWQKGPDAELFNAVFKKVPELKLIAEDLGIITKEVEELKQKFDFPGLKIVEFAFDNYDENNAYLPRNYEKNCVGYFGSHDNDTLMGYLATNLKAKENILKYYNCHEKDIYNVLFDDLFKSKANVVIYQIQDVLKQKNDSRMNVPGTSDNNWVYRMTKEEFDSLDMSFILQITTKYNRI